MTTPSRAAALAALMLVAALAPARAIAGPEHDYFMSKKFDVPSRGVELQYFRVPRDKWEILLTRMAQYNADTIHTYVHWGFHEYEEGKFDFTGKTLPERDLAGFIKLCHSRGFKFVLKPGPFIDAETTAGGIPTWLFEKYPETVAADHEGKPFVHGDSGMPRVSYLHPKYLELVGRYYNELGKAVSGLEWPKGPIVAIQVDNETPGDGFTKSSNFLGFNFKADYNDYYVKTAWPKWLEERYGTVGKLNEAYGVSAKSFDEVDMPRQWGGPKTAAQFEIYKDLDRFAEWQYVEGLRRYSAMLRGAGFRVPLYQDLLCMPWDMAGMIGDIGGMSDAVGGWIGSNIYAEVYRLWTIFTGNIAYKYNMDEYVHMPVWRTRLAKTLSEPYPAMIPEITCSERFYFMAPAVFGADMINIYVGWQTPVDNELTSPKGSWGMEACVTAGGEVRDCFWNGKVLYTFMEHAGNFRQGADRPRLAIGYSHEPEHAWNWEFRFNLNKPDKRPKLKDLQSLVKDTNTGDRGQLMARALVGRDVDFDVLHLDHLKEGQIERYDLVIVPDAPGVPRLEGDNIRYLKSREEDIEFIEALDPAPYRMAYSPSDEVDVTLRYSGPAVRDEEIEVTLDDGSTVTEHVYTDPAGPVTIGIANRGASELDSYVYFFGERGAVKNRLGPKSVGFVTVEDGGIRAAVLNHEGGLGEVFYGDDLVAFTGTFAAVANEKDYTVVTALDSGHLVIRSKNAVKPEKAYRLFIDGRIEEAEVTYEPELGRVDLDYDAGSGAGRTDLYLIAGPGVTPKKALGEYLKRAGNNKN